MRQMTTREKIIVVGAALAVVFFVLYSVVFLPRLKALNQTNRQLRAKIVQVRDMERVAASLPVVREEGAQTQERLRAVEQQIPRRIDVPQLLAELTQAIDASGVRLADMTFPEQAPPGAAASQVSNLQEVAFIVHIRGTFDQTVAFLRLVEALPRIVVVDTLGIAGQADLSQAGKPGQTLDILAGMKTFALR